MSPLNIKGIPYDAIETCRWILKHTIYDLFYPLVLGLFALSTLDIFDRYFLLLVICEAVITIGLFFYYWIRSVITREKNVGSFNTILNWRSLGSKKLKSSESQKLNPIDKKNITYEIGFVGDIMKMKSYTLKFSKNIENFFKNVDLIVGNLEGMINNNTKKYWVRQKHQTAILKDLKKITYPTPKWLLSISNNHSADFEKCIFDQTQNIIDNFGKFKAFGYNGLQNYSPIDGINIVSGTMWNNYKNTYASQFSDINTYYEPESFNILYPHWHFENECYVRRKIKKKIINLLLSGVYHEYKKVLPKKLQRTPIKIYKGKSGISAKWDLIFGHHSHVPQPIVTHPPNNNNQQPNYLNQKHLLAYSGGNFTSSKWINKHQHGLILRCQLAKKNEEDSFTIRKIDWSYTECERDRKTKTVQVDIDVKHNKKNVYDFRVTKLIFNMFVVSIFYFFATPIISSISSIPIFTILEVFRNSIFVIGTQFIAVWAISRILYKYKKPLK